MSWVPHRTFSQVDAILCGPGMPHQIETCMIDGRLQRVYKNLWPSLRDFWLWSSSEFADRTYIVFEQQRWTYRQIAARALNAASVFKHVYGIQKGDRVGICSRNYPEYLVAFWATHLIGAVSVLANAWLPLEALHYCLTHTECKLIILDAERANRLEPVVTQLALEAGTKALLVLESHEGKGAWAGMEIWNDALEHQPNDHQIQQDDPCVSPEDNATIIFTSGTTGLPKGVLSSQRGFLTNLLNITVGSGRAILRRGEDIPTVQDLQQKAILVSVPLFHVTGSTAFSMLATSHGMKIVMMRKWVPEEGDHLAVSRLAEQLTTHETYKVDPTREYRVPSMVSDLAESSAAGHPLDSLTFGGSPAPDLLPERARRAFPSAILSQSYGLTETNSVAVSVAGEDYSLRPSSTGRASPVNDIMIMKDGVSVSTGHVGEVWLRGPNVMKEYWRDTEATNKVITRDGWLKTGDLGLLDEDGFLYIRDRIKDIIIRGGENIDSVSVENALYADVRVSEVAAVGVPDKRLGELVTAVVVVKPALRLQVSESELIAAARKRLPNYAVPVMVLIQETAFEHTPSGKILKGELRKLARAEWERRSMPLHAKL